MSEDNSIAIESEFSSSWDQVERFYHFLFVDPRWGGEWAASMLSLIAELRKRKYDRKLRAGNSRAVLILSRSRKHGLRSSHQFMEFGRDISGSTGMSVIYHKASEVMIRIDLNKVELTSQVEDLLNQLVERPID
jgi:hypothetical protein